MNINWKRGLLRAWIVGFVLWACFVGWSAFPGLIDKWPAVPDVAMFTAAQTQANKLYAHTKAGWSKSALEAPPWLEVSDGPYVDYLPDSANSGQTGSPIYWKIRVKTPNHELNTFAHVPYDSDVISIRSSIATFYREQYIADWWAVVIRTAIFLAVPPMLVLLVALMFRWIFVGFRIHK